METVELVKRNPMGILVIKNPPYNILTTPVFVALQKGLDQLKADEDIRLVIITGQGLFSAGADVVELNHLAQEGHTDKVKVLLLTAQRIVNTIEQLGKPTIAAVDGYCLGGGNEIVMACTACVSSDQAQFGQPEVKLAIMPGLGGTQRMPRRIGIRRALELLLTGNFLTAGQALELGLVDKVVPQAQLISKTKEFAIHLLEHSIERKQPTLDPGEVEEVISTESFRYLMGTKPPEAVRAIVRAVREGVALPLGKALALENEIFSQLVITPDAMEGLAAFLEKRPPEFSGMSNTTQHSKPGDKEKIDVSSAGTSVSAEPSELPEYRELRKTVSDFARREIEPHIETMETEERILPDIIAKMGELGFYGICCPVEYGGVNFGKTGYCILFEELSRVHASTAVLVGAHVGLAASTIQRFGTDQQKRQYLVPAVRGEKIGAFALTEPEAGSDAANIQTMAQKKENKWILNGTKQFITNGDIADFVVVIAQTDKFLGTKGLTGFIVETGWPGFTVGKHEKKIGIRAAGTTQLIMENLEVPAENMLGQMGQGFKIFMNSLNGGRLGLAAGCLGAAREAFKLAYDYASQRVQFGRTLIEQEAIQFYFAEMRARIYLMESAVYRAAAKADKGKDIRLEAAILKLTCSEMSSSIIDKALQVFGGYGYIEDYPIARMYRDARINRIFEGTNEIQKLMIFKELFKSGGTA